MFNFFLYRIAQFIALILPLKIGYGLAKFCSDIHYMFADKDRRFVRENLKVIFPEKSRREIRRIRIRMARNFAKYLVDFFRFSKLDSEYVKKNIKIENAHFVTEALSKGKGVIILSAHLGNWELGAVVVALLGYPFWAVVLPHKHKYVDRFFNSQRESKGVKVIPLGKAARMCITVLKKNELLALVGDRDFTESGIAVDFFGKPSIFPKGPAALALNTGAVILPGFMVRNSDDSFTLWMDKPIECNPPVGAERKLRFSDSDLMGVINQYKGVIESYIRKYPDQWYMFKRFWIA